MVLLLNDMAERVHQLRIGEVFVDEESDPSFYLFLKVSEHEVEALPFLVAPAEKLGDNGV